MFVSSVLVVFTWLLKRWVESCPAVSPFGTCVAIPCACICCAQFDRRGVWVSLQQRSQCSLPSLPRVWAIYWNVVFSFLPLSLLGLSVTGARVWGPNTGGSWLGYGFGQASRVFWRLGGVIAIAPPGPLGHLTSTCDVGVNFILTDYMQDIYSEQETHGRYHL